MAKSLRFTTADLENFPDDGNRYEIIDGELYVSTQPDLRHQTTAGRIFSALDIWDPGAELGLAILAPGVIFSSEDAVAPDVVWISRARLAATMDSKGHLHIAPELVVEILSPGSSNEQRDCETKLKLYSLRGVREYWIVDWRQRQIEIYRRQELALNLVGTVQEPDELTSPLLPGFRCSLERLFIGLPPG
jgi:Uma2 family endonuclease